MVSLQSTTPGRFSWIVKVFALVCGFVSGFQVATATHAKSWERWYGPWFVEIDGRRVKTEWSGSFVSIFGITVAGAKPTARPPVQRYESLTLERPVRIATGSVFGAAIANLIAAVLQLSTGSPSRVSDESDAVE